mmetsp:Transcript_13194/g.15017  ORF Transcript_13194/g.15017 Transcript_13194/m.15017 type:complete len:223 (+) Transcript_13194:2-670(+)
MPLQTCSLFTGLNKYRGLKPVEKRRLAYVEDEDLVEKILDVVLGNSEKTKLKEGTVVKMDIRSCYVTFYEFIRAADIYDHLLEERQEYISQYYTDNAANEEITSTQAQLTEHGAKMCTEIFNRFDVDKDDALCWDELSALNAAAGIPLTRSAYTWVQEKFETNQDGNLTREGYFALFLDNFKLSPNLMYRDLVRLNKVLAATDADAAEATDTDTAEAGTYAS